MTAEKETKHNAAKSVTGATRATIVATLSAYQAKRLATSPPVPSTRSLNINGEDRHGKLLAKKEGELEILLKQVQRRALIHQTQKN